ncbi:MAG: ribonuclease III family protein [Candidatus Bathyarchaeia archaeon]
MRTLGLTCEEIDELLRKYAPAFRETVEHALANVEMSKLGDAYLNFLYSLAESKRRGKLCSARISNHILGEALRRAGLRSALGSRLSRRDLGGAVEALILAAIVNGCISSADVVEALSVDGDVASAVAQLLGRIKERWR